MRTTFPHGYMVCAIVCYISRQFWHAKFCSTFPDGFQITQNAVILELCKVCNFIELPLSFGCWGFEAWFWGLEVWGWEFEAWGWGFVAWRWGLEAWGWVFEAWGWALEVLGWGLEACGWGFEAAGDYHKINICSYYQWNDVELSAFAALVLVADVHGLLHSRGRFRFGFVKHFDKSVGVKGKKEVKEEKILHPIFFSSFFIEWQGDQGITLLREKKSFLISKKTLKSQTLGYLIFLE